jgi:hypothetical protein
MRKLLPGLILLVAAVGSADLRAQQSLQMEGTEITGNKELPMVLYIVPWKSVQRFEIEAPPITSVMDQKLVPLERASFKRTIHYHEAIYSKAKLD